MPTFQGGIDWVSIFAPLLAGEQTMMQNRQQQFENKRQQQNDAQAAAINAQNLQLGQQQIAQNTEREQDYQANRGTDPTTGKPFVMPQNLTRIRPPGKKGPVTAPEEIAHLTALLDYYTRTHQKDLADEVSGRLGQIQTDYTHQQNQDFEMAKAIALANITGTREAGLLGQREGFDAAQNASNHQFDIDQQNRSFTHQDYIRTLGTPQNRQAAIAAAQKNLDAALDSYGKDATKLYSSSTKDPFGGTHPQYSDRGQHQQIVQAALDKIAKNPALAAKTIQNLQSKTDWNEAEVTTAITAVNNVARAAQQYIQAQKSGGSNASGGPTQW